MRLPLFCLTETTDRSIMCYLKRPKNSNDMRWVLLHALVQMHKLDESKENQLFNLCCLSDNFLQKVEFNTNFHKNHFCVLLVNVCTCS